MIRVFVDTEFTVHGAEELLSVGLVSEDGRECYLEFIDDGLRGRSSDWVRAHVLLQFGLVAGAQARNYYDLANRLAEYMLSFGETVLLCYDYGMDKQLVLGALRQSNRWAEVEPLLFSLNINIETSINEARVAYESFFAESAAWSPLRQHHALADARALRASFEAFESVEQR